MQPWNLLEEQSVFFGENECGHSFFSPISAPHPFKSQVLPSKPSQTSQAFWRFLVLAGCLDPWEVAPRRQIPNCEAMLPERVSHKLAKFLSIMRLLRLLRVLKVLGFVLASWQHVGKASEQLWQW